jgi:hypothetical protein
MPDLPIVKGTSKEALRLVEENTNLRADIERQARNVKRSTLRTSG